MTANETQPVAADQREPDSAQDYILQLTNVKKHFNIGGGLLRGNPPAIALKGGRRRAIFVVYWSPAREYGQRRTRALWAKPEGGAPWWQYL